MSEGLGDGVVKVCGKCGEEKTLDNFSKNKANKACGLRPRCKQCEHIAAHVRYMADPEKQNAPRRLARKQNPEKIRVIERERYAKNPEIKKKSAMKWYYNNIERAKESRRKWSKNNFEKRKTMHTKWRDKNREHLNAYYRQRRATNPTLRLRCNLSAYMSDCLRHGKGGRSWEKLVNFTLKELMAHLEKQFQSGMTWSNYGEWHIDHIIPVSVFNYTSPEHIDFKRCWSLSNLQPLWAKDNFDKKAKITEPFQPSLRI